MEAIDSSLLAPNQSKDKHRNTTAAKLGELTHVSEKSMDRAKFIHDHGIPEDEEEVAFGEESCISIPSDLAQRLGNRAA
jgi:hypothetical protein